MSDLNKEMDQFDECSAMAALARQREDELNEYEKFNGESRVVRVTKYNKEPVVKYTDNEYQKRKAKRLERLERELAEEKRRQSLNNNWFSMLSEIGLKIVKGTIHNFERHDSLYNFTFDRITIDQDDYYNCEIGEYDKDLKNVNIWFSVVSDHLVDEICIEVILTKEMIKGE